MGSSMSSQPQAPRKSESGTTIDLSNDKVRFEVPREHPNVISNVSYDGERHLSTREGQSKVPDRALVTPDMVPWSVSCSYEPVEWTSEIVLQNEQGKPNSKEWADKSDFKDVESEWLLRSSHCRKKMSSLLGPDGLPRNPVGRTGRTGRGSLGKWGPNHAADPIVTCTSPITGQLYMVAIKRADNGKWAIPGGMVDAGELVSRTLTREFYEEAAEDSVDMERVLAEVFSMDRAKIIYRGYVDDPRNTDNAWVETVVVHFHTPPHLAERLRLSAGDDAISAAWVCIEDNNTRFRNLYANHREFVNQLVQRYRYAE